MRNWFRRQWRIAVVRSEWQIAHGSTPRWHAALIRLELRIRGLLPR